MANENELEVMPRRVMTLFLLVDTSGSMSLHGNIGKVNSAIEEMIPLLQEVSDENADAEIKVAVLSFATSCKWITNGAQSLDSFFWNDLQAGGVTSMGGAFVELESKLSRKEFLASSTGAYAPVIIVLSDGQPTDNWKDGLEKLKRNKWYQNATKIAITVDNSETEALTGFTGTSEAVLQVNSNRDDLKSLLCRLVVVSSTMQSRSHTPVDGISDEEAAQNMAKAAIEQTVNASVETGTVQTADAEVDDTSAPVKKKGPWDFDDEDNEW